MQEQYTPSKIFSQQGIAAMTALYAMTGTTDLHGCTPDLLMESLVNPSDDYYVWEGPAMKGTGRYFISGVFSLSDTRVLIDNVKAKLGLTDDRAAAEHISLYSTGLTEERVVGSVAAFCEIDHMPFDAQQAAYDAFSLATGLKWSMQVHSGGKSIHGWFFFDRILDPQDPIREQIQRLLIVAISGDSVITEALRKMRTPGTLAHHATGNRAQVVLALDEEARYSPEHLLKTLKKYVRFRLGIVDAERAFSDLHLAELLFQRAKTKGHLWVGTEASLEIMDTAEKIRSQRGHVDPDLFSEGVQMVSQSDVKRGRGSGSTELIRVPPSTLDFIIGLGDSERVLCPVCRRDPYSGIAHPLTQAIYCHGCKALIVEHITGRKEICANHLLYIKEKKTVGANSSDLVITTADLVGGKYVDAVSIKSTAAIRGAGVVVIKAGRGRGKTYLGARVAEWVRAGNGRIVGSAPTITLSRALSGSLKISNYRDHKEYRINESVVACTPSLTRIGTWVPTEDGYQDRPIDLLVLDECEQQIRSLKGSHLSDAKAKSAWDSLVRLASKARSIYLLDADAGALTRSLLKEAGRTDILWVEAPGDAPRTWITYPRPSALVHQIEQWVSKGERVAIHCRSKKYAQVLAKKVEKVATGKVVLLTPKTVGDYDLTDLSWMRDVQVLLYSPVLGTGVSIDASTGDWDRLAMFSAEHTGTADDALQGAGRVRDMDTVHVYGKSAPRPEPWETNTGTILKMWMAASAKTRTLLGVTKPVLDDVIDDEFLKRLDIVRHVPDNMHEDERTERYVGVLALSHAFDRSNGQGWQYPALLEIVSDRGDKVIEAKVAEKCTKKEKDINKKMSALRKKIKQAEAIAIVDAPPLTEDAAKVLRKKSAQGVEADSLRLLGITRFYGEEYAKADRDDQIKIVLADNEGRRRSSLRRIVEGSIIVAGGDDLRSLKAVDRREVTETDALHRQRHHVLHARLVKKVLDKAGLGWVIDAGALTKMTDETVPVSTAKATEAASMAAAARTTLLAFGIPVQRDLLTKPIAWVRSLLRHLGLAAGYMSSTRANKSAPREYSVVVKNIVDAHRLAGHYRLRLLAGVIEEDGANSPTLDAVISDAVLAAADALLDE